MFFQPSSEEEAIKTTPLWMQEKQSALVEAKLSLVFEARLLRRMAQ